MTVELFIM